jgi:hypothetical protein
MKYKAILTALLTVAVTSFAAAQVPFNIIPDWLSVEDSSFGTGCAFGDVDRDSYLDLAVSNGNDMELAPNYLYFNDNGVLPDQASWISNDSLYSGHCEFGDIDSDGFPEFMVANYISPYWRPGSLEIYDNIEGVMQTSPIWRSDDSVYSFRASFGDPDGDGDLDLGAATGEAYHNRFRPNLIFLNDNGTIETTPGWVSADSDAAYDVQFVDIDNDGDQDLAILCANDPVKIYYNHGDSIETNPGWVSSLVNNGNSFDFADIDGDGFLDMGVAYNDQLGDTGYFCIYYNDSGLLNTVPDWYSSTAGYGSEAVFCDIDGDGDQDFIGGRWFDLIYVYLNNEGVFGTSPGWQSDLEYELVVENIVFADIDYAEEIIRVESFPVDGTTKLFYLSDRFLQSIDNIYADGRSLEYNEYCYSLEDAWVSLAFAPSDTVAVFYRSSDRKDMAVSNWDGSTYIFYNTGQIGIYDNFAAVPGDIVLRQAYPNPFNARTTISYYLAGACDGDLIVYDLNGRLIRTLVDGYMPAGENDVIFDAGALPSGIYFYKLRAGDYSETRKMVLIK